MLDHTVDRLRALASVIQEICALTGTPGLSYGIIHQGSVVHKDNFGVRDIETQLPPTSDTVYHLASLSKTFTAAVAGILDDEGMLSLEAPVQKGMPAFGNVIHPDIAANITLTDLLSHRTGLAPAQNIWYQSKNRYLLNKGQSLDIIRHLDQSGPFRTKMQYSNFQFDAAGEVMETATGLTWGQLIKKYLVEPLELPRTFVDQKGRDDDNYAKGYMVLDSTETVEIERPPAQDGTLMAPANGVRSCVNDLLKFYSAVMAAWDAEMCGPRAKDQHIVRNVGRLFQGRVPLTEGSRLERAYATGFVRTQLPSPLGAVGYNGVFVPMPDVCRGSESRLVLYHQGSLPGYTTSVFMFPETQTAIVVLTNSLGIADCADWIGQLLIETYFDCKQKNDYVDLARRSADGHRGWYDKVGKELAAERKPGTSSRVLNSYTGRYWNTARNWFIEVFLDEDEHAGEQLMLAFQGHRDDLYPLTHYQDDTFTWGLTRDEGVKRVRFTFFQASCQKILFAADSQGNIDSLRWPHEAALPEGELLQKLDDIVIKGAQEPMRE